MRGIVKNQTLYLRKIKISKFQITNQNVCKELGKFKVPLTSGSRNINQSGHKLLEKLAIRKRKT